MKEKTNVERFAFTLTLSLSSLANEKPFNLTSLLMLYFSLFVISVVNNRNNQTCNDLSRQTFRWWFIRQQQHTISTTIYRKLVIEVIKTTRRHFLALPFAKGLDLVFAEYLGYDRRHYPLEHRASVSEVKPKVRQHVYRSPSANFDEQWRPHIQHVEPKYTKWVLWNLNDEKKKRRERGISFHQQLPIVLLWFSSVNSVYIETSFLSFSFFFSSISLHPIIDLKCGSRLAIASSSSCNAESSRR